MIELATVIDLISRTPSTNDKLYILKKDQNMPGFKEVLRFIYNPYVRTGISKAKLAKALGSSAAAQQIHYTEAIDYFSSHTTGTDADLVFAAKFIKQFEGNEIAEKLAKAIVTQDLKIGVSVTSLNTVYGKDFIPKIGCMLGTPYGDVGAQKTKWPCIVTEKLDGIRRILVKENGTVRMYSRSGHEDFGLVDIMEDAKYLPNNAVYDGELLASGSFTDCIAQRQATNSIANSGGVKTGLTFNVFDMVPTSEFYAGVSTQNALTRKLTLGATLMDESISLLDERWYEIIQAFGIHQKLSTIKNVPILGLIKNFSEVDEIVAKIWAAGGEGVMLNTTTGFYEIKRSKSLLKVKHTEEHVLVVTDFTEGLGKNEDSLGSLVVTYKDNKLGVGSGFSDALRAEIWNNQEKYIGRSVEIETFGESTNAMGEVSLNCPIFKRFVGAE